MNDAPIESSPPDLPSSITEACLGELDRLKCETAQVGTRYKRWHDYYEWLHYAMGVPATIFAAVAGVTAFAQHVPTWVVGGLAACAAALVAVQTFVRPDNKARFNRQQQLSLEALTKEIAMTRICLVGWSPERAVEAVRHLENQHFETRTRLDG